MSHVFTPAKTAIANGDLVLADAELVVIAVGSSTTADTEEDAEFVADLSTLDEISATNYSRKTLTGVTVNQDDVNNRAELDADDVTWTALGGALNDTIAGFVIAATGQDGDNDALLVAFINGNIFPGAQSSLTTNGSDVTITWSADGIIQLT